MRTRASPAVLLILTAVYFAAGKLGLTLAFVHPSATPVWPPTGIALAAFLLLGYRAWPGILLGAFLVNQTTAGSVATSIGIALGNTLEGLAGAYLVRRFARGLRAFERPEDVFRFAVLAGMASTTVSATIGVTSLALGGYVHWADWASIWLTWWLGDAGGDIIVAPLLILWGIQPRLEWARSRVPEAVVLVLLLFLVGQTLFGGLLPLSERKYPLEFLCVPILVWAAFRFGPRETAAATMALSGIAIWGTLKGFGAFARETPNVSLLLLQAFLGVIAVMALALAAAVLEQRGANDAIRAAEEKFRLLERRQAEEALRAGEAALAEAQALAHVGSWSWDIPTGVVAWSDELYRIFGLDPQSEVITYERLLAMIHPEDRTSVDEAVRRSRATGEPFAFDHRIVGPDGRVRWINARGQVVGGGQGPLRLFGSAQDITERKQAEEAKRAFIANAAHELRTPLTTMIGLSDILGGFRGNLTEAKLDEYCDMIKRQGDRARRLITGLLDLSRMDQGLLGISLEPMALADAANRALDAVPFRAGTSVHVSVPDGLAVLADPAAFERVAVNLLTNASLYGGSSVRVEATESAEGVLMAVSDDGPGVPEALLPHLFDPFTRGATSQEAEGSGLGLAIARGIVEAMGGTIAYQPGEPSGARFVVLLKRAGPFRG